MLTTLVKVFGQLPDGASRAFARILDASARPFHEINYFGSLGGPRIFGYDRMSRKIDRVVAKLLNRLERECAATLIRGMYYPTAWDPYFKEYMTLEDVYRYPTQHFEHHRRQLTLADPSAL